MDDYLTNETWTTPGVLGLAPDWIDTGVMVIDGRQVRLGHSAQVRSIPPQ